MAYLLLRENSMFKQVGRNLFIKAALLENRALLWIWLAIGTYGYLLSNTTEVDDLRGPFVLGVLLSFLYSVFNVSRFIYKAVQTKPST